MYWRWSTCTAGSRSKNQIRTSANAERKPTDHIAPEIQTNRLFHLSACAQAAASVGSAGQTRPGRYTAHAAAIISAPETENTQPLYILRVISHGAALAMEAMTEPRPRVTNRIGNTQHVRVAVVVNRRIQLHDLGLSFMLRASQKVRPKAMENSWPRDALMPSTRS